MRKIIWFIKYRVIIFFILFIIISTFLIKGYFSTAVTEYVRYDCTNKINEIIVKTINEQVVSSLTNDSLMHVTYNENKEVVYAYIDTKKTNEILGLTSSAIVNLTNEFNDSNESKIEIPLGFLISGSAFFSSDITLPVTVSNIASYNVKLNTVVEEYGINSSLVTVNLNYDFSFKAMLPLISSDVYVCNSVPLLTTVLYGNVPNYFFSGTTPNVSIN